MSDEPIVAPDVEGDAPVVDPAIGGQAEPAATGAQVDWSKVRPEDVPDEILDARKPGFRKQLAEQAAYIKQLEERQNRQPSPTVPTAPQGYVPAEFVEVGITPDSYRVVHDELGDDQAQVKIAGRWYDADSSLPTLISIHEARSVRAKIEEREKREQEQEKARSVTDAQKKEQEYEQAGVTAAKDACKAFKLDPAKERGNLKLATEEAWKELIEEYGGNWQAVPEARIAPAMAKHVKRVLIESGRLDQKQAEINDKAKQTTGLPSGGTIPEPVADLSKLTAEDRVKMALAELQP